MGREVWVGQACGRERERERESKRERTYLDNGGLANQRLKTSPPSPNSVSRASSLDRVARSALQGLVIYIGMFGLLLVVRISATCEPLFALRARVERCPWPAAAAAAAAAAAGASLGFRPGLELWIFARFGRLVGLRPRARDDAGPRVALPADGWLTRGHEHLNGCSGPSGLTGAPAACSTVCSLGKRRGAPNSSRSISSRLVPLRASPPRPKLAIGPTMAPALPPPFKTQPAHPASPPPFMPQREMEPFASLAARRPNAPVQPDTCAPMGAGRGIHYPARMPCNSSSSCGLLGARSPAAPLSSLAPIGLIGCRFGLAAAVAVAAAPARTNSARVRQSKTKQTRARPPVRSQALAFGSSFVLGAQTKRILRPPCASRAAEPLLAFARQDALALLRQLMGQLLNAQPARGAGRRGGWGAQGGGRSASLQSAAQAGGRASWPLGRTSSSS